MRKQKRLIRSDRSRRLIMLLIATPTARRCQVEIESHTGGLMRFEKSSVDSRLFNSSYRAVLTGY